MNHRLMSKVHTPQHTDNQTMNSLAVVEAPEVTGMTGGGMYVSGSQPGV